MINTKCNKKKNVLLLGGTGAIGIYLIEECLKLGYTVYVTTRKNLKSNKPNLYYINGDAKNESFISQTIAEGNYSVIVDFMVYTSNEFNERIDLLLSTSSHYIFISTYRVFAETVEKITENSPLLLDVTTDKVYLATDEYALAKARQERILKSKNSNKWSIVRPSITYSTNRFQLGTLEASILLPRAQNSLLVPIPTDIINKKTTMTWAGDVAKMIGSLMLNEKAYKEDFNVVTSEAISWKEVAEIYRGCINLTTKEVSLLRFGWLCGNAWQLKYDRMVDRICNNNKVLSVTGLKQKDFMPISKGIPFEINNNQNQQQELSTLNRAHGRIDRILNIWQWPFKTTLKETVAYLLGRIGVFDKVLSKLKF